MKTFANLQNENVLWTTGKGQVTMQSEVGEEVLYEMMAELQIFIWHSVPVYL